jgi:hypothetical protein
LRHPFDTRTVLLLDHRPAHPPCHQTKAVAGSWHVRCGYPRSHSGTVHGGRMRDLPQLTRSQHGISCPACITTTSLPIYMIRQISCLESSVGDRDLAARSCMSEAGCICAQRSGCSRRRHNRDRVTYEFRQCWPPVRYWIVRLRSTSLSSITLRICTRFDMAFGS